jgi:ATP-binding cassette subfamily B (MDR/TAP) protein 1
MDSVIESEEGLKVDSPNRADAETSNSKIHEEDEKELKTESDLKEEKKKTEKNKQEEDEKTKTVPFHKLFAFADSFDIILMILGTIGAVGNGLGFPIMTILFGDVIDVFGQNQNSSDVSDKIAKVINIFYSFTFLV